MDIQRKLGEYSEGKKARGTVWLDISKIVKEYVYKELQGLVSNKAWYSNILYENLRRILNQTFDKQDKFLILGKHSFKLTDDLYNELKSMNLKYTTGELINIITYGKMTDLPKRDTLELNFSTSAPQMFRKKYNWPQVEFEIQINGKNWIKQKIVVPLSVREMIGTKIANPKYYYKYGKYICDIAYEVIPLELNLLNNILGIDLGKIKLFSGTVLFEDGTTSQELLPSKRLETMIKSLNKLYDEKQKIYDKNARIKKNKNQNKKLWNRKKVLDGISTKIVCLKKSIASLVGHEIVDIAREYRCSEIHLENLSWLKSVGGKWNFSEIQRRITEIAELYNIKIVKVNCKNTSKTHPITNQIVKPVNRNLKFITENKDKTISIEILDRDQVASINLAKRKTNIDVKSINKSTPKKKRKFKSNRSEKRKIKKQILEEKRKQKIQNISSIKENAQIVVFSPNTMVKTATGCPGNVCWASIKEEEAESLLIKKHVFIFEKYDYKTWYICPYFQ